MSQFRILIFCVVSCLGWSLPSQAVEYYNKPTGVEITNAVQVEAEVVAINKKKRELTLRTSNGEETAIIVGEDVKNFAQIKKGDRLKVRYLESLVLDLKKGGGAPVAATDSTDVRTAEPGQKPAAVVTGTVTSRGTVTKVDKKNQTVTVMGPNGERSLRVKRKDLLDQIKKGDQIEATYTEALAVSVESVKK